MKPVTRNASLSADVCIVGGGLAGCLAAVRAARDGVTTVLVQDRPVLGGNASKEIGVNPLGAGGGQNNCYFRETGLLEELLLDNLHRNPEGLLDYWDATLLDFVHHEENLTVLLNTVVDAAECDGPRVVSVSGLTLGAETRTTVTARLFVDASGDGVLGALAGAPFRQGREARAEFGEPLAPETPSADTMGASLSFWGRDLGHPVPFVAPSWARPLQTEDFRGGRHPLLYFRPGGDFQGDWWMELGAGLDHVYDAETIRWESLRLAYGVWDYAKNRSPRREELANYALLWVSTIAGKRESRRFEGDYLLTENDLLEQRAFPDVVAYGGWSLDDHAPGGFDDDAPGTVFFHLPGLYGIPLRCLYSRTVENLFFAGRNVSVTHRALSSTRLISTCALLGEAAGRAASFCLPRDLTPRALVAAPARRDLQQSLLLDDLYLPGLPLDTPANVAPLATVSASSSLAQVRLESPDGAYPLAASFLHMFPVSGALEQIDLLADCSAPTTLAYELLAGDDRGNYFPGRSLYRGEIAVPAGPAQWLPLPAPLQWDQPGWVFLRLEATPELTLRTTSEKLVGVNSFSPGPQVLLSEGARPYDFYNQYSPWVRLNDIWTTRHQSACFRLSPASESYAPAQVVNGYARPCHAPNLWISEETDFSTPEWLELSWEEPVTLREVRLTFDTDLDYFLRAIRAATPFRHFRECVRDYRLELHAADGWQEVARVTDNHQRLRLHPVPALPCTRLRVVIEATHGLPQARIYSVVALRA